MMVDSDDDIYYETTDGSVTSSTSSTSEKPPVPPHVDSDNPSPTVSSRSSSSLSMWSFSSQSAYSDESNYEDVENLGDSDDLGLSDQFRFSGNSDDDEERDDGESDGGERDDGESDGESDGDESDVDDESNGDYVVEECKAVDDDNTDTADESDELQSQWRLRLKSNGSMLSSVKSLSTEEEIISLSSGSAKEEDIPPDSIFRKKPIQQNAKRSFDYGSEIDHIVEAITDNDKLLFRVKLKNAKNGETDLFEASAVYENCPQVAMKFYEQRYQTGT